MKERKMVSATVLARRWSVSSATVVRLIQDGELEGMKIRGAWRAYADAAEAYEERRKRDAVL